MALPFSQVCLHTTTLCHCFWIRKNVFTNISNLRVSEKKGFGILSPPSDLEKVSIQEGEKNSTYTQYMLVSYLLSTFHSVFRRGLSTDFLKGNNLKDRKTNKISVIQIWIYPASSLLFSFKNASLYSHSQKYGD